MSVTCHKILYFRVPSSGYIFDSDDSGSDDEGGLGPGLTYTPGHSTHMPWYDADRFELYRIEYDGDDVTNKSIKCPDSDFVCEYFFNLLPPSDWEWDSYVKKGVELDHTQISATKYKVCPLTAREWNNFIDRVVDFFLYTGGIIDIADVSTWYVTKGTEMLAEEVEIMRELIATMNPPTALPSSVTSGRKITAAYINGLKNSLNSIERE